MVVPLFPPALCVWWTRPTLENLERLLSRMTPHGAVPVTGHLETQHTCCESSKGNGHQGSPPQSVAPFPDLLPLSDAGAKTRHENIDESQAPSQRTE